MNLCIWPLRAHSAKVHRGVSAFFLDCTENLCLVQSGKGFEGFHESMLMNILKIGPPLPPPLKQTIRVRMDLWCYSVWTLVLGSTWFCDFFYFYGSPQSWFEPFTIFSRLKTALMSNINRWSLIYLEILIKKSRLLDQ